MPDITMCSNKTCPLRERCYRFRAVPSPYWQSFCEFKPTIREDGSGIASCEMFSPVDPTDKLTDL